LPGGCVAEVYRVDLADGTSLVAKVADQGGLAIEGRMLAYLKEETSLPVPAILAADDHLLLMDYIANDNLPGERAEAMAAEQLAALHRIEAPAFGFAWDTVIGALPQPNTWSNDWCGFFRDQRLMTMGRIAEASGRISGDLLARLERFCERLEEFLDPPAKASLIHGDVWRGKLVRKQVWARVERFARRDIPSTDEERRQWLLERWREVDSWIADKNPEIGRAHV
jgi:fructosamine-3-kinase